MAARGCERAEELPRAPENLPLLDGGDGVILHVNYTPQSCF